MGRMSPECTMATNSKADRGVCKGGQGASRGDLMTSSSSKTKEVNAKPCVLREDDVMNNTYQGLRSPAGKALATLS